MALVSNGAGESISLSVNDVGADPANDPAVSSRFVNVVIGEPQSLDPAWDYETAGVEILQNVYETLVAFNGSSAIDLVPRLATEVPTVANGGISPDGLDYTFHLRTDVKFHDDTIMDADDVIYSIKRCLMINDLNGASWMLAQLLYPDWPGNGVLLDEAVVDASMTKVNSTSVVFHLIAPSPSSHTPSSSFLYIMAYTAASIVSMEYVEAHGGTQPLTLNEWMNTHECGSGPYALDFWTPGNEISLRSSPDYWRTPAAIEQIQLMFVFDQGTREMMLANGDASSVYATRNALADYETMPGVRMFQDSLTLQVSYFGFNQNIDTSNPSYLPGDIPADFFADVHVRQAFVHAFNYTTYLTNAWQDAAVQPNGPIPLNMFGHDPSIPNYTYDPSIVEAELELAMNPNVPGQSYWDTGFTLNLYLNSGSLAKQVGCELIKADLEAVNSQIHINIIELDWPTYLMLKMHGQLTIFYNGWAVDYPDPDDFAFPFCHEYGSLAIQSRFSNSTLTDLVNQAAREINSTLRLEMYSQIQQSCYENAYYLWTDQPKALHVERTWVEGYYYNPTFGGLYYYDLGLDVTVPGAPTWSSISGGYDHIDLIWNEPTLGGSAPVSSFILYKGAEADDLYFLTYTGLGYVDYDVVAGQTYYYAVRAVTSVGDGALSDVQSGHAEDVVPNAPTIGTAMPGATTVTVYWTAPVPNDGSPLTSYTIFYGTSPNPSIDHILADPDATDATVTGLTPRTPYYFNVVATNDAGDSPPSEDVSATTTDIVPNAPHIGTATPGLNQVTVTWTPPSSNGGSAITSYRVYYGISSNPVIDFVTAGATDTSKVIGELDAATQYFFNVVALNTAGASAPSGDALATTTDIAPDSPIIGTATPGIGSVMVTWTAPAPNGGSPLTGYRVYFGLVPNPTSVFVPTGPENTSVLVTDLNPITDYFFNVVASNAIGDSPHSEDVLAMTLDLAPNPPSIATTTAGISWINLSWTVPTPNGGSAVTGYVVYYGQSANPLTLNITAGPGARSANVTGLVPRTIYFLNVVAMNDAGISLPSSDISAETLDVVPNAPTIGTATPHHNSVTVTWTAPAGNGGSPLIGYKVYHGTTAHPSSTFLAVWPANSSAVIGELDSGTTYYFNVVAVNAEGNSAASSDASAETLRANPPSGLWAWAGDATVELNWTAPSDTADHPVLTYRLVRTETPGDATMTINVSGSSINYIDHNVTLGKSYEYELTAVTSVGDSLPINSVIVQVRSESRISLEVTTMATTSFDGSMAANLTRGDGSPMIGAEVRFTYSRNGISWTLVSVESTLSSGVANAGWSPSELNGTYFVRAEYLGNQTVSRSSDTVSVNLVSVSDKYVLSVSSTSTVSDFAFNASKNELTFSVSGETGTAGHARIILPEGLIDDPTKLTVKVDGLIVSHVLTAVGGGWAIDISYSHSAHPVIVSLGALPDGGGIDTTLLIAFGLVAVVIVIVVALLVLRKKKG